MSLHEAAPHRPILGAPALTADRYPPRTRFAIIVGSSAVLWTLILAGGWRLWALIV
ncbi:MAG TPA: hypothetical protein VFA50_23180 [Stellaceae bacterium]|nr:hypothetical protein [Stellaceae bacterium]